MGRRAEAAVARARLPAGCGGMARGVRAMQVMPRAAAAPAPQSQKKRERREYETTWPAWQTETQIEQQPSDCVRPHV
jgi:hypothetical protein